jgi:hypothetical protein
MMLPTVLGTAAMGSLIHGCVATQHRLVANFCRLYRTTNWYLATQRGSGVPLMAGTVPVDPFCFTSGLKATKSMSQQLHFDLTLSSCVVEDEAHRRMVTALEGRQHCSLISASGAGKTKAVLDLLKVSKYFAAYHVRVTPSRAGIASASVT